MRKVPDVINRGWEELREATLPPDTPDDQVQQHRDYFFGGARYLLSQVVEAFDLDDEAASDRLAGFEIELQDFIEKFTLRRFPTEGRG